MSCQSVNDRIHPPQTKTPLWLAKGKCHKIGLNCLQKCSFLFLGGNPNLSTSQPVYPTQKQKHGPPNGKQNDTQRVMDQAGLIFTGVFP